MICVKCNYSTNSKKDYTKYCTTKNIKSHGKEKIIKMLNFVLHAEKLTSLEVLSRHKRMLFCRKYLLKMITMITYYLIMITKFTETDILIDGKATKTDG